MNKELNIDKTTCWYQKQHYVQALNRASSEGDLTNTKHGKIIEKLINYTLQLEQSDNFLDVGCGIGEVNKIVGNKKYTGVDLPEIIEKGAKIKFPGIATIKCDLLEDNIYFISQYDIVFINGLINIMQYSLETLDRILSKCKKFVILHRINMHEKETRVELGKAYAGSTYNTIINEKEFYNILKKHNFKVIKRCLSGFSRTYKSFVLKKKKI